MAGFIEGVDRGQASLFPERLDDWICEDHMVRVVDLFVDELDLVALGFGRSAPARTGRPGYHPAVLLKIFIYGYLNRIPSSRRLEREAGRNVELMWLTGRLAPDHKTIADFRRDNGPAICKVCAQFIELCRRIGLLKGACVAIDGSKFKAVNNRDRNFTKGKIASRLAHLEADVNRYIDEMIRVDRQETGETRSDHVERLARRYGRIRQEIDRLKAMEENLAEAPDGQISLTDPDARAMATSARLGGTVGYNVQTAVDTETHLIVAHEVTNQGFDRNQLASMARAAKQALRSDTLHAIADKGYFSSTQILTCHEDGITTTVPRPETSGNRSKGMFVKADFAYEPDRDVYRCPAGAPGVWEIVQAGAAELLAPGRYRLTRLLRGQRGTEGAMVNPAPAGARVVVLDDSLASLPIAEGDVGIPWNWRIGPASRPVSDDTYVAQAFTPQGVGLRPFSVAHVVQPWRSPRTPGDLTIRWTRRSRALSADSWGGLEVPLAEELEAYEVEILDGATVKRVLSTTTTSAIYTAADQTADWGAPLHAGDTLDIRIYQLSALIGRGALKTITLTF